ncbi:MAG: H-NS histone family protein [Gallionella sp.]|jgi:DNA-binding protein H-NS|nr:H-NS histone family protein [Gallionella sp.]
MPTYHELSAQIASLMQQAEAQRRAEVAAVIRDIRGKMAEYGILAADLGLGRPSRGNGKGHTVAVKYRNAATGETWTGRGKMPRWLAAEVAKGRTKEEFAL